MRVIALLLLLSACSSEPKFDDRYNEQAAQMNATAAQIEAELNGQLNAANAASPKEAARP